MRKDFVPLTAHVIRRRPWARGKKKASERKEMQPARVEFINEEEVKQWNNRKKQ